MASESTYTPLRMAKELYMLQNNGKRKRGRKPVFGASQFYPWKVELEMKEFIASMLRENGKLLKELALLGYQADGLDDVNSSEVFTPSNIEEKAGDFFREVSDFSSRKMDDFAEKAVGRTIGYIPNQSKLRDDFVNNFVANCKSAAEDQKKEIAAAVYKHRMFPNEDSGSLVKEINSINTKYTKNKSKFIARNETGNLNGAIQRTQMEGAGFRYYKWMCMLDGVTRDTHRSMNGLVCKWEDDTVYSDDGGKTWKKRTGSMFIGQPGQDYNCRCSAIPFDPELDDDYEVKEMPEEKPEEQEKIVNFEKNLEEMADEFLKSQEKLVKEIEKEVFPQTDEEKLAKARASGLYTEKELNEMWPAFLANKAYRKFNEGAQKKHIIGTNTFKNYDITSKRKNYVGAAFFNSDIDIKNVFSSLIGSGLVVFKKDGSVKEEIVKYVKKIGFAGDVMYVETDVVSFKYSPTKGFHVSPVHPNKYEDTIEFLKKRK
ncbi:phage minor head protein [Fibrobacter sp.]|uniref:phage minor head protein n=1 Tax=Fibrobacter sp. TaxID=35828 RepID=UPI00388D2783